ncbi:MAG: GAF domain-containing protein, partial [Actinobacteria bacterium]|nr:GAF domain-containing protein [Actinomycetota bacterium]
MWEKRYESLVSFCEAAAWSVDSEAVYQNIVDAGVTILGSDGAHLHLLTIDGKQFVRHASHADEQALAGRDSMFSVGVGRTKWMMRSRQPIFMDHLHPHCEDIVPEKAVELGFISAVSIPLLAGGDVLGMFSAEYKKELPWTEADQS